MGDPEGNVFLSVDLWATQHTFFSFSKRGKGEREWRDREDELRYFCTIIQTENRRNAVHILVGTQKKGFTAQSTYIPYIVSQCLSSRPNCDPPTPCPTSQSVPLACG
jgi:hypothetical protein